MNITEKQTIRFDRQGRVRIPQDFRQALGVEEGTELVSWLEDGRLVMEPRQALLERVKARYREVEGSMADELIAERRAEAERE